MIDLNFIFPPVLLLPGTMPARRLPKQHARQQRGNALLYTLLALVLGGIGLSVGIGQYQDAERSTAIQATVGEVNSIIGAAKQNFGQYGYQGVNTATAVASQVIPSSMAATTTTASNRFGGAVSLEGNTAAGTAVLVYAAVPSNVCINIVNGTQALARQVQVNGGDVKPLDGVVSLNLLTTQCGGGAGTVPIAWTIGRI
jgi:hypothetical protein